MCYRLYQPDNWPVRSLQSHQQSAVKCVFDWIFISMKSCSLHTAELKNSWIPFHKSPFWQIANLLYNKQWREFALNWRAIMQKDYGVPSLNFLQQRRKEQGHWQFFPFLKEHSGASSECQMGLNRGQFSAASHATLHNPHALPQLPFGFSHCSGHNHKVHVDIF